MGTHKKKLSINRFISRQLSRVELCTASLSEQSLSIAKVSPAAFQAPLSAHTRILLRSASLVCSNSNQGDT